MTKGYAAHEKEIFEAVANARARMLAAGGSRDETRSPRPASCPRRSPACSRLAEHYPDLKADAQFARLSDELAGTENRIATERRRYNEVVQEYNTLTKSFPAVHHRQGARLRRAEVLRGAGGGEAGAAGEVLIRCAS